MIIAIDFEDVYQLISLAPDFTGATFHSFDRNGKPVLLMVLLKLVDNSLLPGVHNLAFGPINEDGSIDDQVRIKHNDSGKLFSTILLFCLKFLQKTPGAKIGLDGSCDTRAKFYHRIFINNKNYLGDYFVALGIDWCVRLLRDGKVELDSFGNPLFRLRPELFDYQRTTKDLYRYCMFYLMNGTK
jgi:hypothetical protein